MCECIYVDIYAPYTQNRGSKMRSASLCTNISSKTMIGLKTCVSALNQAMTAIAFKTTIKYCSFGFSMLYHRKLHSVPSTHTTHFGQEMPIKCACSRAGSLLVTPTWCVFDAGESGATVHLLWKMTTINSKGESMNIKRYYRRNWTRRELRTCSSRCKKKTDHISNT